MIAPVDVEAGSGIVIARGYMSGDFYGNPILDPEIVSGYQPRIIKAGSGIGAANNPLRGGPAS